MPQVELVNRDGVELIRTGTWQISTGKWNASREDLAAAVAAMACPAVRPPILKIGHTDQRFTPGDGEPAIGRVANLRTIDGGHTLIGDYVGVPAWLDGVMASAYPDRSVEGSYNFRCQIGHTHPFVLTGVALLGVTPPGVGTLKQLDDVKALYGLAASQQDHGGGVRVVATIPTEHVAAAADGSDDDQLKHYWTKDPRGLAQWANSPHPWTALFNELKKHIGSARAKRIASAWFHEVFGIWPGERKGVNPTGPG